jgi:hypothetical protein
MRIDSDNLKALYQAYVRSKTPSSTKGCPSPKKMIRLLRSKSSDKEATEIVDHISRCSSCFCEFEFLLEVLRKEKDFIQEVEQMFPGRETCQGRKGNRQKIFGLRMDWRTAFFLASFVLVGFLIAKLVIFRTPEKYRTGSLARVELLQPVEQTISKSSLVFKWEDVRDSEYYVLELFDQALSPIWKSEKIAKNSAVLPEELAKTLEINRSYFWMVTASITHGEKITSRLVEFVLRE